MMFSWLVECGLDSTDNGVYTERKKTAKPLYGELKQHSLSTGKWRWFMKKQEYDSGNSSVTFLIWLMNWIFPFIRRVMMMQNCNVHSDQKNKRKKYARKCWIFSCWMMWVNTSEIHFSLICSQGVWFTKAFLDEPHIHAPYLKLSYLIFPSPSSLVLYWDDLNTKSRHVIVMLRYVGGVAFIYHSPRLTSISFISFHPSLSSRVFFSFWELRIHFYTDGGDDEIDRRAYS